MLRFHKGYFLATIFLFIVEVLIALFVRDKFVRPYFGDFIVVILIYCFIMSFLRITVIRSAFAVLLFAYFIEVLQYFRLIKWLGLENSRAANIILGSSFSWVDMLVYTV